MCLKFISSSREVFPLLFLRVWHHNSLGFTVSTSLSPVGQQRARCRKQQWRPGDSFPTARLCPLIVKRKERNHQHRWAQSNEIKYAIATMERDHHRDKHTHTRARSGQRSKKVRTRGQSNQLPAPSKSHTSFISHISSITAAAAPTTTQKRAGSCKQELMRRRCQSQRSSLGVKIEF